MNALPPEVRHAILQEYQRHQSELIVLAHKLSMLGYEASAQACGEWANEAGSRLENMRTNLLMA